MANPILYYGDTLLPPESSAVSQADSTTRGTLTPRMTTTQRDAIPTPATGLLIYNITTNTLDYYDGAAWQQFATLAGTETFTNKTLNSLTTPKTITPPGTTGDQTINKPSGRVNIAAAGTSVTVTNSLVTANSIILAVAATADATAQVTSVVPGSGSFVIHTAVCTAETAFNWLVVN